MPLLNSLAIYGRLRLLSRNFHGDSMLTPVDIQIIGSEIAIRWSDGRETYYPADRLRAASPSAEIGWHVVESCSEDGARRWYGGAQRFLVTHRFDMNNDAVKFGRFMF